jgi:pseudaminic acid biosynthesis-associated methylase
LIAINRINKQLKLRGYEINEKAALAARKQNIAEVINTTVVESLDSSQKFDLTFTKGVLIHINPDMLPKVYQNLYDLSNRYIMVCEYYNPAPVSIDYRGNKDRLFKRDFAGELIQQFNFKLVDYGFNYQHDPYLTNDDSTWFLMEKLN